MFWIPEEIEEIEDDNKKLYDALVLLYKYTESVSEKLTYLYDLVPVKYKKLHPKPGESPFFGKQDMHPTDPKEYEQAKQRMADILKRINEA